MALLLLTTLILEIFPMLIAGNRSPTDLQGLMAFKASIARDPLNALADWGVSVQHCNWTGVACDSLDNVISISLPESQIQGVISPFLANISHLASLDLRSNLFHGAIPPQLGLCSQLTDLELFNNSLTGTIPHTLGGLPLQSLDLANNFFVGSIPDSICNCTNLTAPLMQRFTKRDLEIATESFSADNIIGSSTNSTVYRGVLRNGKVVAVKTLKMENSKELERCFKRELYTMARIRHRSLVKVLGYAWDNRLRALVMEFMPNGNLDAVLHSVDAGEGRSAQLDLSKRLSICISIAEALVYLHEDYDFPIVHCDLKPANILLDEEFEAHVSDFGTARMLGIHLLPELSQGTLSAFQLGTIGYVAPEFAYMATVTPSADVFSFGIILMELLTRTRPTNIASSSSASDQRSTSLQEWIENGFKDCKNLISLIDPLLLQNVSEEQEEKMASLLKISLLCTKAIPENRPSMSQVLPWLLQVKENRMHA